MDLIESPCGFAVRFKESVSVIRVAENVESRPVTGNELVFPIEKVLLQPVVKCVEQVSKCINC